MTDPHSGRRLLRILRSAERAIPASPGITRFIARWNPDAVLVTPLVDFASNQVDYLKSAARLGIPTAACIASWDNLTNKGLLRITPDRVLVWNDVQKRELVEMHDVPEERAVVTGGPKFDSWFAREPSRSAEEHKRAVGLDPRRPYLLYTCSSPFIAPDEVSFVRRWLECLRSAPSAEVRRLGALIRPHPQNARQWAGVELGDGAVIWPRGGEHPDFSDARAGFFDSIFHSAAVVGVNTSAMIDSVIVGRNVLTILDPAFAATQEGTIHFHYLLRANGGFLEVAQTLEEHREQVAEILREAADEPARLREFVSLFVRPRGLDRPVAPIVAAEIERLAALPRRTRRERVDVGTRLLRLTLLLPTVAASAALCVGALGEWLTRGATARRREQRRTQAKGETATQRT